MGKKARIFIFFAILAFVFMTKAAWGQDEEEKPGIKTPVERMEIPKAKPSAKGGFGIGVRLWGGWNYLDSGDLNDGISGLLEGQTYGAVSHGYTYSGNYNSLHDGLNGGLDILIHFSRNFSLVIGTEYFQAASDSERVFTRGSDRSAYSFHPELRALPLKLGLLATLPLGRSLNLYLQGGVGYYWTQLLYEWKQEMDSDWIRFNIDATAEKLGYHATLGLELKLAKKIFFFLEAQGRFAEVDDYSGTMTITNSAGISYSVDCRLYYFKVSSAVATYEWFWPDSEVPTIPGITDLRDAVLDFGGYGVRAGVRIRF